MPLVSDYIEKAKSETETKTLVKRERCIWHMEIFHMLLASRVGEAEGLARGLTERSPQSV